MTADKETRRLVEAIRRDLKAGIAVDDVARQHNMSTESLRRVVANFDAEERHQLKRMGLVLGAIVLIAVVSSIGSRDRNSPAGAPTTATLPEPEPPTSGVVASGGLACRDRATYIRLWPNVAGFFAGGGGRDSLTAFAARYPGCRVLAEGW